MSNIVTQRDEWSITDAPVGNTRASITKVAVAGARHIIRQMTFGLIAGATASVAVRGRMTDGTTVHFNCIMAVLAGDSKQVSINCNIQLPKGLQALVDFDAAAGVTTIETVSMSGYTESDVVQKTE